MAYVDTLSRQEADALYREALRLRALSLRNSVAGGFHDNVRIGEHNVRTEKESVLLAPIPWRVRTEVELFLALREHPPLQGCIPELRYIDPDGRFVVQAWEDALRLDRLFQPTTVDSIPMVFFTGLAGSWRHLLDFDVASSPQLAGRRRLLPSMARALALHDPGGGDVPLWAPEDLPEYMDLHVRDVTVNTNRATVRSDFLARRYRYPEDAALYARRALGRVETDTPLALALPDGSLGNLAVTDVTTWTPFFYDIEMVGPQDPRHAVANLVVWSPFSSGKSAAIVAEHHKVAPRHLRRTFVNDVSAWADYSMIHRAMRLLSLHDARLEQHAGRKTLDAEIEKMVVHAHRFVNGAGRQWGAPYVSRREIGRILHEAAALKVPESAATEAAATTAMTGFGAHPGAAQMPVVARGGDLLPAPGTPGHAALGRTALARSMTR